MDSAAQERLQEAKCPSASTTCFCLTRWCINCWQGWKDDVGVWSARHTVLRKYTPQRGQPTHAQPSQIILPVSLIRAVLPVTEWLGLLCAPTSVRFAIISHDESTRARITDQKGWNPGMRMEKASLDVWNQGGRLTERRVRARAALVWVLHSPPGAVSAHFLTKVPGLGCFGSMPFFASERIPYS